MGRAALSLEEALGMVFRASLRYGGRLTRCVHTSLALFLLFVHLSAAVPAGATGRSTPVSDRSGTDAQLVAEPYVPGEVVIGWMPGDTTIAGRVPWRGMAGDRSSAEWQRALQSVAIHSGLPVLDISPNHGLARLATAPGQEQAEIGRLTRLPWVTYAALNYVVHAAAVPDDPLYPQQWNLTAVKAEAAWEMSQGNRGTVVAVIDSGVDPGHPEFAGRLLTGLNYTDQGQPADTFDDYGHGTHVAGILAAAINNGIGVAGLAPKVRILPIKVLNAQGNGTFYDIQSAIYWATDYLTGHTTTGSGRVLNLSLGGYLLDSATIHALQAAIDHANANGVLVVAASGNFGQASPPYYPAACRGVLAVGATQRNDRRAPYSNYGSFLSLVAPGGVEGDPILSTLPTWKSPEGYGYDYGTSMAAPLVSATAALTWDLWPGASPAQITVALEDMADKVPDMEGICPYSGGRSDCFGYGRLNAARSVRYGYAPSLSVVPGQSVILLGDAITSRTIPVAVLNRSERLVTWWAEVGSGAPWMGLSPANTVTGSTWETPGELTLTVERGQLPPGRYSGFLQVNSVYGLPPSSLTVTTTLIVASPLRQLFVPMAMR
jgi:subtilisin family serine protease